MVLAEIGDVVDDDDAADDADDDDDDDDDDDSATELPGMRSLYAWSIIRGASPANSPPYVQSPTMGCPMAKQWMRN